MSVTAPNHDTHVPVMAHVPAEEDWNGGGRAVIPPPTLWRHGVKCVHKLTGTEAIVRVVDLGNMMFRGYYPSTQTSDGRTAWQHCRDWNVAVTLSPEEEKRVAARRQLQDEIALLDEVELAAVEVLVDDPDATKSLAKLHALRSLGIIKAKPTVVQAAIAEKTGKR